MIQLDRALVSHWFGLEKLAFYTVILNLTSSDFGDLSRHRTARIPFLARKAADRPNTADSMRRSRGLCRAAARYAFASSRHPRRSWRADLRAAYAWAASFLPCYALVAWTRSAAGADAALCCLAGNNRPAHDLESDRRLWLAARAVVLPLLPSIETVPLPASGRRRCWCWRPFMEDASPRRGGRPAPSHLLLAWSFAASAPPASATWPPRILRQVRSPRPRWPMLTAPPRMVSVGTCRASKASRPNRPTKPAPSAAVRRPDLLRPHSFRLNVPTCRPGPALRGLYNA